MTKHPEIYYYFSEESSIIYWTDTEQEDRHDLILLGSSTNPNKKMAISVFTHKLPQPDGWTLRPLD